MVHRLKALYDELGAPAPLALYVAARKRGIAATRLEARQFTARQGERQVFTKAQPAEGKVAAEDIHARYQADLLDMKNAGTTAGEVASKNVLVLVNVFTREIWARAMTNKTAAQTTLALESILDSMDAVPGIMSTDEGAEFKGVFSQELEDRGIGQKYKDGRNSIAIVDRAVASLKLTLAKMMATRSGSWKSMLPAAVDALNATPKPVLHNEAPGDVEDNDEVQFMLLQDNARNLQKNTALLARRKGDLERAGNFRAPIVKRGAFKRGNDASYGNKKELDRIEGSTAVATDGMRIDVKHLQAVEGESTDVTARLGDQSNSQKTNRQRQQTEVIRDIARVALQAQPRMSIQALATVLKRQLRAATDTYARILLQVKLSLANILRLFPATFVVEGQWVTRA